jgi:hypothetical protein
LSAQYKRHGKNEKRQHDMLYPCHDQIQFSAAALHAIGKKQNDTPLRANLRANRQNLSGHGLPASVNAAET